MSLAFGFALPHWQAISGGFSPQSLFAGGVQGVLFDISDLTTLFTTSAGTTQCAMPGQGSAVSVGLMLDKSQGLVLGPELVDTANTAAAWTAYGTNLVQQDGDAVKVTYVNDSQGAYFFMTAAGGLSTNLTIGKTYLFTCEVKASGGTVSVAPFFFNGSSTGAGSVSVLSTSYTTVTFRLFEYTGGSPFVRLQTPVGTVGWIRNISVRELPGNHAISFNDTTARPELRARVNLLTYSEDLTNAAWTKDGVTAANTTDTTDPLGGNTADILTAGASGIAYAFQGTTVSSVASVAAPFSFYVKAGTASVFWLYYKSIATEGVAYFATDLTTQAVAGSSQTPSNLTITSVGGNWFRISAQWVTTSGSANYGIGICNAKGSTAVTNGRTGYVWGADLRPANIGANVPAYQRIADANTYDTSGFPLYLRFDGIDDSMYTPANLNLSGTDKVAVFAGVRKLSDAVEGIIAELSASYNLNAGSFTSLPNSSGIGAANTYTAAARGSATAATNQFAISAATPAPVTSVFTATHDISGDLSAIRLNGAASGSNGTGDQGTGNFGTYPLFIGSRNNSSLRFNGQLYSLIIAGSAVSAGNISATEQWVAGKTGITI